MDPDNDMDGVMKTIASQLKMGLSHGDKSVRKQHLQQLKVDQPLRVKCEYCGEKRSFNMTRPVTLDRLRNKIQDLYSASLNLFFTQNNGEVYVLICNQEDLQRAITLVDKNDRTKSLKLFLTMPSDPGGGIVPKSLQYGNNNNRETPSPPPGSLPPHEKHYNPSASCSSVNSEGVFIPEHEVGKSMTDSISSLDSSYASQPGGDTYPFRHRRDSRRSIMSDPGKDEYSSKRPFGTYPRNFDHGNLVEAEGHGTFPRSNHMSRYSDIGFSALRFVTRGSDGTLSNSSSSSGFPPDPDDSPDGRMFTKRNSDLDSPVFSLNDHRSPRAPSNWTRGARLGSGAFGEVFLCYDKDTGRELAVKQVTLVNMNAETSKEVRALENEILLLRNVHHERIVQYYGCQQNRTCLSIFMEYMPGGSVKDELNKYGSLKESLSRKYTRHVLEGLAYLHENVIVHRDIKGANILRDSQGNVKLSDFGASKRLQTICSATGLKTVVGTPYWMAPEIINGDGYGRKADVWSVGCTVVEMLTTKPPWAQYESMAAIFKIATEEQMSYELPTYISSVARDFLRLTFKRTPHDRPSAEDLLRHRFTND
ncbi:hypothetical protein ScPMuIL_016749 [Solemya velum]